MNNKYIYERLPWPLQNVACNWYGWKEKRLRMGGEFKPLLTWLKNSDYADAEEIKQYQDAQVRKLISYAKLNVPFYQKMLAENGIDPQFISGVNCLINLPILTKEDVVKNKQMLISLDADPSCLVKSNTSGTTGTALEFYKTQEAIAFQWAVWWRHRGRFGFNPGAWHANFTARPVVPLNQSKPPYWRLDYFRKQFLISSSHLVPEKARFISEKLKNMRPKYFTGYCSQIAQFASLVESFPPVEVPRPKFIFLGAENVGDSNKAFIERVTGASVTDQYGFAEGCGNASRCEYGNYHEDWEFGVLECIEPVVHEDGSRTGRIVATGFANQFFPFIRYEVGDTATWAPEDYVCPCGRKSTVLWHIDGRNEDYILTPEGNRVMRWDYLFKNTPTIREAQVVQREYGAVVIRIVPRQPIAENDLNLVRLTVKDWISPTLNVDFEIVDEIERSASGKFKPVVSELDIGDSR